MIEEPEPSEENEENGQIEQKENNIQEENLYCEPIYTNFTGISNCSENELLSIKTNTYIVSYDCRSKTVNSVYGTEGTITNRCR